MSSIAKFLQGFADIVSSLVNFLIDTFKDLVFVVQLLGDMLLKIPSYFGWLPSAVVSSIVAIFGIVLIYKILGREG